MAKNLGKRYISFTWEKNSNFIHCRRFIRRTVYEDSKCRQFVRINNNKFAVVEINDRNEAVVDHWQCVYGKKEGA